MFLRRRHLIATTGLAAASLGLPRIAIGQADRRPSITIAVQQIANSRLAGAVARAVQCRPARLLLHLSSALITQNLLGKLEDDAGPGGELEAHRRTHRRVHPAQGREVPQRRRDDGRRRGLHLQPRAHVRAGLRHHLEQDAVHLGADPRFGPGQGPAAGGARRRQAPVPRRSRRSRRSTSTRCASPTARPTSRSKAASAASGSDIVSRRAFTRGQELDRLGARAGRRPAPTRCASSCPTSR